LRAVGIPVFNEEANLEALLRFLLDEPGIDEVVAIDDCSTDSSLDILTRIAHHHDKLRVSSAVERSGQLDADALPEKGACANLFDALDADETLVAVSGRPIPDESSQRWLPARFRSEMVHRIRAMQHPLHTIIGRFFAVRRNWFLEAATRSDIIANDAFLGCVADRGGHNTRYIPSAICYYGEAQTTFDFAAQRQRADAGYAQLRELGVIRTSVGPRFLDYVRLVGGAAARDPAAGLAWIREQAKSRALRAYRVAGASTGSWEVQASTKRLVAPPPGDA
jgi:glycosyltransferase involved in cell wall biosynthesis